jgi:DNA repair protein RadC
MDYREKSIPIKQLSEDDRPREKLIAQGRQGLSNAELVAILIGSGNADETAIELAQRILQTCNNNLLELGRLEVNDLCQFKGIGTAKAVSIIAAMELGRRRQMSQAVEKLQIRSSKDLADTLFPLLADLRTEAFWILYLNRGNRIIGKEKMSAGGVSGTVVDIKLLMKHALQHLSSVIAVAHNHPSGTLQPSQADIQLTKKIKQAAELMDIRLLDHIIVAGHQYYSFADEGML